MAGPHIWAAKKWSQYRQDVEKAKSKKRKEENDASQSDAEKKIRQWRKDRDKEERRKYVSDFDPLDEDAPPRERVSIVGSDGKVRQFTPPIDLRTLERKQRALQNKVNAKYGRQSD